MRSPVQILAASATAAATAAAFPPCERTMVLLDQSPASLNSSTNEFCRRSNFLTGTRGPQNIEDPRIFMEQVFSFFNLRPEFVSTTPENSRFFKFKKENIAYVDVYKSGAVSVIVKIDGVKEIYNLTKSDSCAIVDILKNGRAA